MYADIDQDGTVDRIQLSSDEDEEGESLDARTQAHFYFRNDRTTRALLLREKLLYSNKQIFVTIFTNVLTD